MEWLTISNYGGLSLTVTTDEPKEPIVMLGGDPTNPDWYEYLDKLKDEFRPHFVLIRGAIERLGWVGEKADSHANDVWFAFSDGTSVGFTMRGWGDLMQAIVGKREGYMAYYM